MVIISLVTIAALQKGFFLLCLEAIDSKSDLCGHELPT
jgi:hypothetical protein